MYRFPTLLSLMIIFFAGCDTEQLTTEQELTLTVISAEEEDLALASGDFMMDDVEGRPETFRLCDAERDFLDLRDRYDEDGDREVDREERGRIDEQRHGRSEGDHHRLEARWTVLRMVYDADGDGDLDDDERALLWSDLDVRCEVMAARILEEYDLDGDGVLSDEERETAREAMRAEREERREQRGEYRPDGHERPDDMGRDCEGGDRGRRGPGHRDVDIAARVEAMMIEVWDEDGDGALDDGEREVMRETLRERIRNAEPLIPRER